MKNFTESRPCVAFNSSSIRSIYGRTFVVQSLLHISQLWQVKVFRFFFVVFWQVYNVIWLLHETQRLLFILSWRSSTPILRRQEVIWIMFVGLLPSVDVNRIARNIWWFGFVFGLIHLRSHHRFDNNVHWISKWRTRISNTKTLPIARNFACTFGSWALSVAVPTIKVPVDSSAYCFFPSNYLVWIQISAQKSIARSNQSSSGRIANDRRMTRSACKIIPINFFSICTSFRPAFRIRCEYFRQMLFRVQRSICPKANWDAWNYLVILKNAMFSIISWLTLFRSVFPFSPAVLFIESTFLYHVCNDCDIMPSNSDVSFLKVSLRES